MYAANPTMVGYEDRRGLEGDTRTLRLPGGYSLRPMDDDPEGRHLLVLTRADGSPVVAFEFSALGPDPDRIWALAVEDEQRVAAMENGK